MAVKTAIWGKMSWAFTLKESRSAEAWGIRHCRQAVGERALRGSQQADAEADFQFSGQHLNAVPRCVTCARCPLMIPAHPTSRLPSKAPFYAMPMARTAALIITPECSSYEEIEGQINALEHELDEIREQTRGAFQVV